MNKHPFNCDESFYGSVTVGDRGQIVIPAEARTEFDIKPGDKILVMRHPLHAGLVLFKLESARDFLDEWGRTLDRMEEVDTQNKEEQAS